MAKEQAISLCTYQTSLARDLTPEEQQFKAA